MVGSSRMNRFRLGQAVEQVRLFQAGQQMADQLHPLGLAAAERGAGLAELEVAQAGIAQRLQRALDPRQAGKELQRLLHRQFQHRGDVLAVVFDIERLAVEPCPAADFAADERGRQEVHLQLDRAGALALGAAALRAVEREPAGRIAAQPRLGHLREQLADVVKEADVGGRDRARRAANGRLVHFIDGLEGVPAGECR